MDIFELNIHNNPLVYGAKWFDPNIGVNSASDKYDFTDCKLSDVQSMVHSINFLGEDLVGAEIGVAKGQSTMTLLHNCPTIKTLHAVDAFKPYEDFLMETAGAYDGVTSAYFLDEKQIEFNKIVCYNFLKFSGMQEKVIFHEMDSNLAAKEIEDGSLDFIFVDTYLTFEQVKNDLDVWYPKVREGGIFAGHDYRCDVVEQAVLGFRKKNNIASKMSVFDQTFMWYK